MAERPRDPRVKAQLEKHGVPAVYLLDRLQTRPESAKERASWYMDIDHLTKAGHAVWGELIAAELAHEVPAGAALARR
jgi:hypothetical protein